VCIAFDNSADEKEDLAKDTNSLPLGTSFPQSVSRLKSVAGQGHFTPSMEFIKAEPHSTRDDKQRRCGRITTAQ
jgi:hypothetical protein